MIVREMLKQRKCKLPWHMESLANGQRDRAEPLIFRK